MDMKKYFNLKQIRHRSSQRFIIAILSTTIWFSACSDFVDVVPENIAVIEDAFETRDTAERFLATLYGYIPIYGSIANPALTAGDEVVVPPSIGQDWPGTVLGRGGQSRTATLLGYWGTGSVSNLFIALRDCNIFLENLDKPFDLREQERKRWEAEAKFLKAYFHFYLMRMYGPIPIIEENIEVSAGVEAVQEGRKPVDEVTAYIVQLLDEAIPDLPTTITDLGDELGRVTAPAGAALKARVLVTAASPLFNGNPDYAQFVDKDGVNLFSTAVDENKWTQAAEACREAIELAESVGNQLYEFSSSNLVISDTTQTKLSIRGSVTEPWNEELIWGQSTASVSARGGGTWGQNWFQARIVDGLAEQGLQVVNSIWSPTMRVAEMFYTENGVPINEDTNYDFANRFEQTTADAAHENYVLTGAITVGLHLHREPRFYASLGFDRGIWYGHGIADESASLFPRGKAGEQAGKIDNLRFSLTGYFAKKLAHYENVQNRDNGNLSAQPYPFPIMRLADMYLLYAEALNESGNISEAQVWIDKVRTRAGLDGVVASWASASSNPNKPTSKEGLRDIIQHERLIELVFEGQRFWDLRRWKRSSEFLNSSIRGWNVEGENNEAFYSVVTNGFYSFSTRDYLWPISEQDIIRNTNLVQNPGW